MQPGEIKQKFSLRKRIHHANHALRGVGIFLKDTHAAWLHLVFAAVAIYLGFLLRISSTEWVVILLTMALILAAEAVNTAIEINVDMKSPGYSAGARDTKDVAAGAVLITVFLGGVIGMIIFLPKVFALFY
jgi:diacylglycerol kinase (ATP)